MADNPGLCASLWLAALWLAIGCGERQKSEAGKQEHVVQHEPETSSVDEGTSMVLSERMKTGKVVYDQYCATCHQSNGLGVPNLNPPLANTEYVTGDKERLIRIVLNGSNEGLEINGMIYSNAMPANAFLSDEELAHVLSYIRNSFGNRADTLSVDEIRRVRDSLE